MLPALIGRVVEVLRQIDDQHVCRIKAERGVPEIIDLAVNGDRSDQHTDGDTGLEAEHEFRDDPQAPDPNVF